jgi:hypothetical protein
MTSSNINSSGKNRFKDNVYFAIEWLTPSLVAPDEIQKKMDSFALCGRKISRMKIIGFSSCHTQYCIEANAYGQLKHLTDEERKHKSNYKVIDPDMKFVRCVKIDEPFMIEFEDGDIFEIDTPMDPKFQINMNSIPWEIETGSTPQNVDANILFSPCIGQTIIEVQVNKYITEKEPIIQVPFNEPPYEREFVSDITLRLENGLSLRISPCIDYCDVECIDTKNEYAMISFSDLKQALHNWEDLHNDEVTGFESDSYTIFFGEKGAKHTKNPYITLSPDSCASTIHISVSNFLILDWCISLAVGDWFNEHSEYRFSYSEWISILKDAGRLLAYENFDSLFDELINRQGDKTYMLNKLNSCGAILWKDREKYKTQITDLSKWTELALNQDGTIIIYGY